jgi:general stress protein YciG
MDSSILSWNVGMINGFFGKNADSFGLDQDIAAKVGSSYGGSVSDMSELSEKAGKKYGLFSSKSRKKVNESIAKANSQQNLMGDIAD